MSRPNKFWIGEPITSLEGLESYFDEHAANRTTSHCFVMVGRVFDGPGAVIPKGWDSPTPKHIQWVLNGSYQHLKRQIESGMLRRAEITPAYKEWLREECRAAGILPNLLKDAA